jgi:hypothetical protein
MNASLSTFSNTIDELIKENKIFRYAAELDSAINDDRKEIIRKILKSYQAKNLEISEKAKEKMLDICNKINESKYKKPWNKILMEHKEELILLYFSELDEKEKEENVNKYVELLKSGKLKNDMVEYDSTTSKIIAIKYTDQKKKKIKKENSKENNE